MVCKARVKRTSDERTKLQFGSTLTGMGGGGGGGG